MANVYSRRSFISRVGLLGCGLPLAGYANRFQSRRVRRIGFLIGAAPTLIAAFEEELRRLGYVDGKSFVIEKRISRPNSPDLAVQAAELAQMDLDLIVAAALPQALEVRKNNPAMPMVIATCPGMVSNGFAHTLKRPGGIYTGMDELPPGVTAKRLRLLKTAAPKVSLVALLSTTPGRGGHEAQLADAEKVAKSLRLTVKPYRAASLGELETALAAIVNRRRVSARARRDPAGGAFAAEAQDVSLTCHVRGERNAITTAMVADRGDGVHHLVDSVVCTKPGRVAELLAARRHGLGSGPEDRHHHVRAGCEGADRATVATI